MSTSSRNSESLKVSASAKAGDGGGVASEPVARRLEDLGRASALFRNLAKADGLKRMSDEQLITYAIALAPVSRALDALFSTARAERARRIKEEPGRFSRELDL